jgi:hypothetical protein
MFNDARELQLLNVTTNYLWLPNSTTFAAVDAIAVHNGTVYLFQCSSYADHGYNYDGIIDVWKNLEHVREHIKGVYLVVPTREVYDTVEWQKLTGQKVKDANKNKKANKNKDKPEAKGSAKAKAKGEAKEGVVKGQVKGVQELTWPEGLLQWKLLAPIASIESSVAKKAQKKRER